MPCFLLILFISAIHIASTKKAPGARINILAGVNPIVLKSTKALLPVESIVPAPISSLNAPRIVIATVKPSPMPRPSNTDGITGFFDAYDSARPRIIQFTTISGIYTEPL